LKDQGLYRIIRILLEPRPLCPCVSILKTTPHIEELTSSICQNQRLNTVWFGFKRKKCELCGIAVNNLSSLRRSCVLQMGENAERPRIRCGKPKDAVGMYVELKSIIGGEELVVTSPYIEIK